MNQLPVPKIREVYSSDLVNTVHTKPIEMSQEYIGKIQDTPEWKAAEEKDKKTKAYNRKHLPLFFEGKVEQIDCPECCYAMKIIQANCSIDTIQFNIPTGYMAMLYGCLDCNIYVIVIQEPTAVVHPTMGRIK